MGVKLHKKTLSNKYFSFNAFAFIPENPKKMAALFTHGYTASKADCVSWAQRLSDADIPVIIFDLPGHHLGSLNSVPDFETFRDHAHECFIDAFNYLQEYVNSVGDLILGGHSLGALLSVFALELDELQAFNPLSIGVGLGIGQHKNAHLFETSFYEKTLNIRRQLVDSKIDSDLVFPWIKQAKLDLNMKNKRIHLITGVDDVVVGEGGMEALAFHLKSLDNEVTTSEPKKLPHHEPSNAASHIFSFIRKEFKL